MRVVRVPVGGNVGSGSAGDRIAGGGDSCDSGGVKFLQFIAPTARPAPDEENEQQSVNSVILPKCQICIHESVRNMALIDHNENKMINVIAIWELRYSLQCRFQCRYHYLHKFTDCLYKKRRKSSPDLAYRLMVLTGDCRCFLLSNLLLTDIFKALLCGNMSQVLKLKNQLVVEEETIGNEGSRLHDVAYSPRRR